MTFDTDYGFGLTKTLVTTFMTLLLMFVLTDFKYSKKKVMAVFSVYFLYVGASSWLLINLFGWYNFMRVMVLSISIPVMVIMYFMANDHAMQAVFNYVTQLTLALVLSMTATLLNTILHGNKISDLSIRIVLFLLTLLLEYRYTRKLYRRVAYNLKKDWPFLAVIPVFFCILIILCGLYPVHFSESIWSCIHVYMAFAVMVCVYIVVFRSLNDLCSLLETRRENDILEAQVTTLKKQADTLAEHTRQDAIYRSDVLYHAQSIYSLIKHGNTGEALSYLRKMDHEFSQIVPPYYCRNATFNDIFSIYLGHAKRDGILVTTNLDIPGELPVDTIELATVLANAIENACDELNALPEGTEKHLILQSTCYPRFMFQIENTCTKTVLYDKKDGVPVREDGTRGVRTQSILAYAKQNDCSLTYGTGNGRFCLRLEIPGHVSDTE